ncbi:DNA primase [Secundilactobacillus odoratitofui DSM 19909 = JCM 15043]|uniref:DNA primase n=2 Tax=Secundilactobacillus odoratitofui TaxID=480930 RepID=A0A0R1M2K4_9LACO|nr:DNA primase [Secundilactobacillus odoratitofui DSM 19909 = JCM 15043]
MINLKGVAPVARIPETVIEQVRDATDIVDFVSQYVQLQKQGKNFFGLCPFHEERTPSFSVTEDKQIFHCFSCGRGGNVFKFVMELENLSFQEAVMKVADFSHVTIDDSIVKQVGQTGPAGDPKSPNNQLIKLHQDATKLYSHILLNTEIGQPALDYLHQRGLTDQTIKDYGLGYAPNQEILKPFFEERQVDYQTLRHSGLFIENQAGDLRDRFSDRIMYPIRNQSGQEIAFSGRLLKKADDQPKYLNSPETELFNKRRVLFNYDLARTAVRKAGQLILFEGFMDVMSAHQAGVDNGVASMGTSLTDEQIYAISRITKQVYVCYDGDVPGQKATQRALTILREHTQLSLGVIQMPEGLDPDEYRQQYGEAKLASALSTAKETPVAFEMRYLKTQHDVKTDTGRLQYLDDVLKLLATVRSPVEQDVYLTQLADSFQLDKASLRQQLSMIRPVQSVPSGGQQVPPPVDYGQPSVDPVQKHSQARPFNQVEKAERALLFRMLHDHDIWLQVTSMPEFKFHDEGYQRIYLLAQTYFETHQTYSPAQFSDSVPDNQLQNLVIELETLSLNEVTADGEVEDYLQLIMNMAPLEEQLKQKQAEIQEASRLGDADRVRQLTIEYVKLMQQKQAQKQP